MESIGFDFRLAVYIFSFTLAIGGVVGGIMTHINKMRFTKKSEFDEHRRTCPEIIGSKIDIASRVVEGLQSTVEMNAIESQKRREADREFLNDHLINIATFIGKVEQYMMNKKL